MKKRNDWTPQEDGRLLEFRRQKLTYRQMADLLPGRTAASVEARFRKFYDIGRDGDADLTAQIKNRSLTSINAEFVARVNALRHRVAMAQQEAA